MKIFKLTNRNHGAFYLKVDDSDAYLVRGSRWNVNPGKKHVTRCVTGDGHESFSVVLLGLKKGQYALHKNGDWMDYRRANLTVMNGKDMLHTLRLINKVAGMSHTWRCGHPKHDGEKQCRICQSEYNKKFYSKRKRAAALMGADE